MKFFKKKSGFSLVELSISITIIALIAGSAISVAVTSDYNTKKTLTENKMERIEEALVGFFALNHRLPCPAKGEDTVDNSSFGLEGTPTEASCLNANDSDGDIFYGVVPIRTLKLPDNFMFDGWNRRISYAVDVKFANNEVTNQKCGDAGERCFIDSDKGGIHIQGEGGSVLTEDAVYILISYGENGHGAYTKNGSTTRLNAYVSSNPFLSSFPNSNEFNNSSLSSSGSNVSMDNIFVDIEKRAESGGEYYDDIVHYKTKASIVKQVGSFWYDSVCQGARDIVYDIGENSCLNADNEDMCEFFAEEVLARCFQ